MTDTVVPLYVARKNPAEQRSVSPMHYVVERDSAWGDIRIILHVSQASPRLCREMRISSQLSCLCLYGEHGTRVVQGYRIHDVSPLINDTGAVYTAHLARKARARDKARLATLQERHVFEERYAPLAGWLRTTDYTQLPLEVAMAIRRKRPHAFNR